MTLVLAGAVSHAPGITGRAHLAEPAPRDRFYAAYHALQKEVDAARLDALVLVGAEHFGTFFMDNMPSFCIGIGDDHFGPIETEDFLKIAKTRIPGAPALARALAQDLMADIDLSHSQEILFDHGCMVPLHFLTPRYDLPVVPLIVNCLVPPLPPLARCWALGKALRRAIDARPERIALIATGGISHWPATPDSGKINEDWDRDFLDRFLANDRDRLLAYTNEEIMRDGGPGGMEIRTFITVAGATEGHPGTLHCYEAIPIFAVGCTVATMEVA